MTKGTLLKISYVLILFDKKCDNGLLKKCHAAIEYVTRLYWIKIIIKLYF